MLPIKKRRQHHVWAHYLEAWTTKKSLFCLNKQEQRVYPATPKNVAVQRDFYRLKEITPRHIDFVREFIRRSDVPDDRHEWTLNEFLAPFEIRKMQQEAGHWTQELEKAFDVVLNNLEEELHSALEHMAIPSLQKLKDGDLSPLSDAEIYAELTWFLGVQLTRTRKIAEVFTSMPDEDMSPVAGPMRHILGLNMSLSLFMARRKTRFFHLTGSPDGPAFVTGDFPVLNVRELYGYDDPEQLVLYYPLAPDQALMLDIGHHRPGVCTRQISEEEVCDLNLEVSRMAEGQVFGSTERELLELQKRLDC